MFHRSMYGFSVHLTAIQNLLIKYLLIIIIGIFIFPIHAQFQGNYHNKTDVLTAPLELYNVEEDEFIDVKNTIRKYAKKYEVNAELAIKIAFCESSLIQENYNENKTNGKLHSTDYGIFQINDLYHENNANALMLDFKHNVNDNISYGLMLMSQQGTQPWEASKDCWMR